MSAFQGIIRHVNTPKKMSAKLLLGGSRNGTSMVTIIDGGSNTRLIPIAPLASHCDYTRFHSENVSPSDFQQLLMFMSADSVVEMEQPWSAGGHATYFENKVIGTHGFVGGFSSNDDGSINYMLQVSGEYWEHKTLEDTWRLFVGLKHRYKVKCSRVDYAIDDSTYWIIPVAEMWDACKTKNNFHFRKIASFASGNCGEDLAETKAFASRESGRYTRIYDHDGEFLRHETEFKRQYAQPAFDLIADLKKEDYRYEVDGVVQWRDISGDVVQSFGDIIARRVGGHVLGAIDFRTRESRKDSSRESCRDSERLGFYQQYIDKVGAIVTRSKVSSPIKTLHKSYEWLKRQCAPTLAMFADGLGRHEFNLFMEEIVSQGSLRMDNLKELWAKEIRRKPTCFQ